jgi:hypothetical protein
MASSLVYMNGIRDWVTPLSSASAVNATTKTAVSGPLSARVKLFLQGPVTHDVLSGVHA